jgi:LPPG:FO 2-phospho-L-lactate transferase
VTTRRALTVLAGGVGAARFLRGLTRLVDPAALTVVVNTADDDRFYGLAVSPDLDTITYTLAGVANPETGWGVHGDSRVCLRALQRFYGPAWFHLGDRDLATHLYRSQRLAEGASLTRVTQEIRRAFAVRSRVLPMSDDPVRTILETSEGHLPFQRYLVAKRARPTVTAVRYRGATRARPAPGVLRAIRDAALVVVAPSNPLLSIGPILAVPGVRRALARRRGPVAAVSPLVEGRAVSGPLARLLRGLGFPVSSTGIAACYHPFLDLLVIDPRDRTDVPALARLGCRAVVTPTVFDTPARAARAARRLLAAVSF